MAIFEKHEYVVAARRGDLPPLYMCHEEVRGDMFWSFTSEIATRHETFTKAIDVLHAFVDTEVQSFHKFDAIYVDTVKPKDSVH